MQCKVNYLIFIFFSWLLSVFQPLLAFQPTLQAPLFSTTNAFSITTKDPLAQQFFNQGMIFYYGFEWGESIRSFKEAIRLDPQCKMCYWGLALALGSKINAPVSGKEYQQAKEAIQYAQRLPATNPKEKFYINALSFRFKHNPKPFNKAHSGAFSCHQSSNGNDKSSTEELIHYAEEMGRMAKKFPEDNDVNALYIYALFEQVEWKFWNVLGKKNDKTLVIINTLERILKRDPNHVGANHYYIHVIESSPQPEKGLNSAQCLKTLIPYSEHLVHMPAHIYFLTGQYGKASESNLAATKVFDNYNELCKKKGFLPEINYLYFHNYDFLRSSAILEGKQELSLWAVNKIITEPFPTWLKNQSSLQWFIPIPYFVKTRFGLWEAILKEPKPNHSYQYAQGMWHYSQGVAQVHLENSKLAKGHLTQLQQIIKKGPVEQNLEIKGVKLLKIAENVLHAQLTDAAKNESSTIKHLKIAAALQQSMGYHEPPDWYFPVNEMLAEAYLKRNHPKKALVYYQIALKQYPNNPWVLYQLIKTYNQLGKTQDAEITKKLFEQAWKNADIPKPLPFFKTQ